MIEAFLKYPFPKKLTITGIIILVLIYLGIEANSDGDFYIYMAASSDLFQGVNVYERTYGDGFHYLYSLFFATILYPFTFLPFYGVKFCWLLLNVLLLWRTFIILFSFFDVTHWPRPARLLFSTGAMLFAARFVHENIHYGQITILILFLCVQGLYSIFYSKRWWWGCVWIALGINIKLLPLVLLPYLIYRGRFKAAVCIIGIDILLWLIPVLILGPDRNQELIAYWWHMMNPANTGHVLDVSERSFHSLTTLLSTLLVKDVPDLHAMPLKRHIADVPLETLHLIINGARLALAGFTLYFLRTKPFKSTVSKLHQYAEMSYILALVPLIFPHQQHYAFLFIVPGFTYAWYTLLRDHNIMMKTKRWFLLGSMVLIYLCCNLKLILGEFNPYYEHYKILTYGALWLLVVLSVSLPRKATVSELPAS